MPNVELVVKMPKEYYETIRNIPDIQCTADMLIIKNGIPQETVTEFADRCRECGREKVLDKIRFEIEHDKNIATKDYVLGLSLALQTIDKYRESGDKK